MWKDVIDLISITFTQNDLGDDIESKTYSQVFVNKKDVRQSEYYQAMNNGLEPEYMFEVRSIDYSNQERVRYNTKEYDVIRTYDKGEITELTVQGVV